MKRNPKWLLLGLVIFVVVIQLYQPERTNPPIEQARTVEAQTEIPAEVSAIIHRACFDCHSHQTRWPWYSFVAPVSWMVADDVEHARGHVNYSDWAQYERKDADHKLEEICEEVEEGAMPLASYRWMHAQARLSEQDVQAICAWTQAERRRLAETAGGGNPSEESHDEEGSPTHSH